MGKVNSKDDIPLVKWRVKFKMNFAPIFSKAWKAKERNLRRGGAIMRGIMRRSMRHRKNKSIASPVGSPPFAHILPGIKNTIQFATSRGSVIVGPQLSRSKRNIMSVPKALDQGGITLVKASRKRRKVKRRKKHTKVPSWYKRKTPLQPRTVRVRAKIRPRPFVAPAAEIFQRQYPDIWKDCIK